MFEDCDVISIYSREQAIEDGLLVDASKQASEAGFRFPLAITRAAWDDAVQWSDEDSARQTYQDESGRLWDVLHMARLACKAAARRNHNQDRVTFGVLRVPRGGRGRTPKLTTLEIVIGPGDTPDPVFTIMAMGED
jgi:hypothetical protein